MDSKIIKKHHGVFGYAYIYYRHDNDDDEDICLSCVKTIYQESGYLPDCNSQYRSMKISHDNNDNNKNLNLICGKCKINKIIPYWTCCLSTISDQPDCNLNLH